MIVLQARKQAYDSLNEAHLLTSVETEEKPEENIKEDEENTQMGEFGNGKEKHNKTVEVREKQISFFYP